MAAVFIVASGMGWIVHRARVQREAVAAIHRANGYVWYEWTPVREGMATYRGSQSEPSWLVDMIGVDYLDSVLVVGVNTIPGPPPAGLVASIAQLNRLEELALYTSLLTDDEMAQIGALTMLKKLVLGCRFTEAGFANLGRLHQLTVLNLQRANVSDGAVTHLVGLSKLEYLDLRDTQVTDLGLAHLRSLRNLKVLMISGPKFTDAGVGSLQRALPKLTISAPDRPDLMIYRNANWLAQPIPKLVRPACPIPLDQSLSSGR